MATTVYCDFDELLARAAQVGWQMRGESDELPADAPVEAYANLRKKEEEALALLGTEAQKEDGRPLIELMSEVWRAWKS